MLRSLATCDRAFRTVETSARSRSDCYSRGFSLPSTEVPVETSARSRVDCYTSGMLDVRAMVGPSRPVRGLASIATLRCDRVEIALGIVETSARYRIDCYSRHWQSDDPAVDRRSSRPVRGLASIATCDPCARADWDALVETSARSRIDCYRNERRRNCERDLVETSARSRIDCYAAALAGVYVLYQSRPVRGLASIATRHPTLGRGQVAWFTSRPVRGLVSIATRRSAVRSRWLLECRDQCEVSHRLLRPRMMHRSGSRIWSRPVRGLASIATSPSTCASGGMTVSRPVRGLASIATCGVTSAIQVPQ